MFSRVPVCVILRVSMIIFPVFRSQQELYALDMTQGMVPKVTEKESSQQY